jgi:hypothetical protein
MFFGQLKMNIALDDRKSTSTQRTLLLLAIVLVMSWFYVLLNTWHDSSHKKNTKELLRNSAAVGIALKCNTLFSVLGFYVVRLNRNKTFCLLSLSLLFFLCIGEKHFVLDTDLKLPET